MTKKAVLLMAYGTPEREADIEPYYTNIRRGRKPTKEELENLKSRYNAIGGSSPLFKITSSTGAKLEQFLSFKGHPIRVYTGMKHWHPFISEVFRKIVSDGVTDLLSIALAPHYSQMSVGSYQNAVKTANAESGEKVKLEFVNQWHSNPSFVQKWEERINRVAQSKFQVNKDEIFFLFTAHSLPERILSWKDPYKDQLLESVEDISKRLSLADDHFGFAFQSAGHTSEPWLGPDILEKVQELSKEGWKNVLVAPIGFVSDHLEILFDIDVETKEAARQHGVHLERAESFNDSNDLIDILYSFIRETDFLSR